MSGSVIFAVKEMLRHFKGLATRFCATPTAFLEQRDQAPQSVLVASRRSVHAARQIKSAHPAAPA
jgi:hypothetical protein